MVCGSVASDGGVVARTMTAAAVAVKVVAKLVGGCFGGGTVSWGLGRDGDTVEVAELVVVEPVEEEEKRADGEKIVAM